MGWSAFAAGHGQAFVCVVCHRRQRLAAKLMDCLEDITTRIHDGYFVDLFVRSTNKTAIGMYTKVSASLATPGQCCTSCHAGKGSGSARYC